MRLLAGLCMALVLHVSLPAGEAGRVADPWAGFAGMREELEGQSLELRDELIAAHLSYMDALELALAEAGDIAVTDERHALAWVRAAYLLETCFRLLEDTGEYDAFLKATSSLRPAASPPLHEAEAFGAAEPGGEDVQGGLEFIDAGGREYRLEHGESGLVMVDASTGEAVTDPAGIRAEPERTFPPGATAYIHLLKARAAWLRALALERTGRTAEGGREAEPLGVVRDWAFLGPLETVPEPLAFVASGLDELYASIGKGDPVSGRDGPVRWKAHSTLDPLGRVHPGALFRADGPRAVLALALVYSPDNLPVVTHFGSDADAVVCVNNYTAMCVRTAGTPDPDQEVFGAWLRRGWNVVMVRTSSSGEDWSFAVRLASPDGSPFPGIVANPGDDLAAFLAEAGRAGGRSRFDRLYDRPGFPERDVVEVLSRRLAMRPNDARGNFYLASFLVARRMMEGPERFDREMIFRRAMDFSGGDPFFTLQAARSVDSDMEGPDREENLRLVLLRRAAEQGAAAALVDIGRLYLDVMRQARRAGEYAAMAHGVNPMSLRAGVLEYDVALDMGWEPLARRLLDDLVRRHPSSAAARLRLGRLALAMGRHRQALSEFHAILAVRADSREALDGAVYALGMLGQTSAAVDLLLERIARFPYDFSSRRRLAELYRTLGRDDEAREVAAAALAIGPDDPGTLAVLRDLERNNVRPPKEGGGADASGRGRQELDLALPPVEPASGWEYLYFQVEDRMEKSGVFNRTVAFALRLYNLRAAQTLRGLGLRLGDEFASGSITRLDLVSPDGSREPFTPAMAMVTGGKTLEFGLPRLRPGVTVEAEVEMRRTGTWFLGEYFGHIAPLSQPVPVRLSRYMFTSPRDRRIFFRPVNGAPEAMVVESPDGESVTRVWEMSDLAAFETEPYSAGQDALAPGVQVSSFANWDEFARWYWRLIGAQYHSPPELRRLARTVAAPGGVPLARLDKAAGWVAENIVHRPWQYGLYAFRPVNARSVLSRLSADGKDRTLLLCLLAREYGLEAWPVLARLRIPSFANEGAVERSLPLLENFNHSLSLVHAPPGGDVFMDASNPYRPPGVTPSRLYGSQGMVIRPDGAEKVFIPDDGVAACDWNETAELVVDEDGSVLWEEKILGSGTAAEALRNRFRMGDEDGGGEEAWAKFLSGLGAEVSALSDDFRDGSGGPASAAWEGRARLRHYASVDGDRIFLAVPPLPGSTRAEDGSFSFPLDLGGVAGLGTRKHDLLLPHGFRVSRRVSIRYPESWRLINPGRSFVRTYPFGTISLVATEGEGNVALDFRMEVPGHVVAAGDYPAFREMAALAARWLRAGLVWEKR